MIEKIFKEMYIIHISKTRNNSKQTGTDSTNGMQQIDGLKSSLQMRILIILTNLINESKQHTYKILCKKARLDQRNSQQEQLNNNLAKYKSVKNFPSNLYHKNY